MQQFAGRREQCIHCGMPAAPIIGPLLRCVDADCRRLTHETPGEPARPLTATEARAVYEDPHVRAALGLADATTNRGTRGAPRCTCPWQPGPLGRMIRMINRDCPVHDDTDVIGGPR